MKSTVATVLLIESSEKKNKIFIQMLSVLGFNVFTVANIEDAIHKTITFPPNIIICNEDFIEYNGFQIYKMLEDELIKHSIPFIMILDEYKRDIITMGQELGIDGFIYPPYEIKRIKNILNKRISKNEINKTLTLKYFQEFWDLIPLGFFIVQNKRIISGNQHFIRTLGENYFSSKKYYIKEIFCFSTHNTGENQLNRFLNGLDESCYIHNIQFNNNKIEFYNLNLFYLDSQPSVLNILGCIVPSMHFLPLGTNDTQVLNTSDVEFNPQDILTQREEQILNLSAKGKPVKTIAEQLGISIRTVEKHRSNIIQKTNAGNIIEAIMLAKKYNLIEL